MRSILILATAVAVLSISNPASAQSHVRLGDLQGAPQQAQVQSPDVYVPASQPQRQVSAPRVMTSQAGIKDCRDFYAARGGWVSPTCTSAELTVYLSANGFSMAPIPSTATTYSSVSPEEQARRDRLLFDEQLRERQIAYDASVADTQADRSDQRQARCERRSVGNAILGGLGAAAVNAVDSRLSRGGYYRGGVYYSPQGSNCASYHRY